MWHSLHTTSSTCVESKRSNHRSFAVSFKQEFFECVMEKSNTVAAKVFRVGLEQVRFDVANSVVQDTQHWTIIACIKNALQA